MTQHTKNIDQLIEIMAKITHDSPDLIEISDLMYHYNKSLGITLVDIREQIINLPKNKQVIAIHHLKKAIYQLKSPNFIIKFEESIHENTTD